MTPENIKQYQKDYRVRNKKELSEKAKAKYQLNKEQLKAKYKDNKEQLKAKQKNNYKNTPEKKQKAKERYLKNRERLIKYSIEYKNKRKKSDILFELKIKIRNLISHTFRRKGYTKKSKSQEILGCSYEQFKQHLEGQFESWMNWQNRGLYNGTESYGWDIDHIIPLDSAKNEEDIIRLNHYTNLQPLCSYVNRVIKRDK